MKVACPLAQWSQTIPDEIAIWPAGNPQTFHELDARVSQLALVLARAGVGRGSRVALIVSPRVVPFFWALWRLRAIACPINPRFPIRQQQVLAEQLSASHFFDEQTQSDLVHAAGQQPVEQSIGDIDSAVPATILFSSGTTQAPKAIVHTLAAHFASAMGAATNIPLERGDRWLASLPFCHAGGLAILIRTMLAGAAVILSERTVPLSRAICDFRATHVSVVSTQLRHLLDAGLVTVSLKAVLLGGGPCPAPLRYRALARGIPLYSTYGLTEMASQVTTTPAGCEISKMATAGLVLPGREVCIDQEEILVRGSTLCLGYFRDQSIVPVVDENGWFHTGDAGSFDDDHFLTVTGRLDEMFISGGENIHPEAIEEHLLALPGVRQAVVVPVDDRQFGQRPVAFVDADPFAPDSWEQALQGVLPAFMIPDGWLPWPWPDQDEGKASRRTLQALANKNVQPSEDD